ncbi:MAG: hypothetical protein FWH10_02255 [Oscillospiraceae bacterium]|nr:hypothetical protein [Oscillospiraceae bacterium]
MIYPYMILADGTEIVHTHIIERNNIREVEVHFERPTENGFDTARCVLPDYRWIKREGFSPKEMKKFELFLKSNAHLLYKYAENGGIQFAEPVSS